MDYSLEELSISSFAKFLQSNILLYCIVFILALKIVITLVSINLPVNIFFADITKLALENFANQTRQSSGLNLLQESPKLNQAAQLKAENMVQNNYFEHTSPSGVTPWFWFLKAGYNYKYAGENLAIGFFDSEEVFNAWLNSPSHKANILNPNYTEVGTAVLKGFGQNNTIIVVQEFASPAAVKTVAVNNNSKPVTVQPKPNTPAKNVAPAPVVATQTQPAKTAEKVLSQETVAPTSLQPENGTASNSLPSKIANSVIYNYDGILQNIIYGVSMVVIGTLLALIFFSFKINFHKQLVIRAVLLVMLLSAGLLINKEIIISLIPHKVLI